MPENEFWLVVPFYVTHTVSFDFIYVVPAHFVSEYCFMQFLTKANMELYLKFRKNGILYGNSRYIKRASLFLNLSVQKSNRTHNPDLERNLLDTEKAGL